MGIAAAAAPSAIFAYYTDSFYVCVALITLVTACHQAWSANIFTTATDLFPSQVSGSVVGLGATTGGNAAAWADAIEQVMRFFARELAAR